MSADQLSQGLSLVNSMSMTFDPYPLILQAIFDQQKKLIHPDLPRFAIILGVVHIILLVVAAVTLILKVLRRQNGERQKIWLWRKHHVADQPIPYLVPNGNFVIEPLQICGCVCYLLFVFGVYWTVKYPQSTPDVVHAGVVFWHAVALVPGSTAFWLSGWGAFYVVYLAPGQANSGRSPHKKNIIQHPLVMNTICISIPVLIAGYFLFVGIAMFIEIKQVINTYELVTLRLNQLSVGWKPNDPTSLENNRILFDIFITLSEKTNRLISMAQAEALGWATVSITMIAFYISTTIATVKLLKNSLLMAGRCQSVYQKPDPQEKSKESLNSSTASKTRDCESKSNLSGYIFKNYLSLTRLQRSYYFIYISCGIMAIVLGLNFTTSVLFAIKMKTLIQETQWQARLIDLITCTTVMLSFSLFLQSLMLSIWG
ncbi:hypothetical protein PGT21_004974 [Puccinia graminis f. sp. tritici]|uniref:Uncharacterized protein n=1 Tax=Puccinia graminis f. sp. tritici TaxID=56615 RepID=A0A5B0LWM3_PUCGR|nr:hypothetical protein PGT21_004974 [Puccinia graminis f. sp. tritici]